MSELKENLENKAIDDEKLEDVSGGRGYSNSSEYYETFPKGMDLYILYQMLNSMHGIDKSEFYSKVKECGVPSSDNRLTCKITIVYIKDADRKLTIKNILF